jgi:predicted nucleic acid-binding protein
VIHLDTSLLVDALTGPKRSAPALRRVIAGGERVAMSTLVLYEWLRGPRMPEELAFQEALLPAEAAVPTGPDDAARAAALYRALRRPRGREIDLLIAACALAHGAALWTLDPRDFDDVPDLVLLRPE